MPDKWLFGWRVQSAIPLPELIDWVGEDRSPDLVITFGDIRTHPPDWQPLAPFGPEVQTGPEQQVALTIPNVARYLLQGGRRVVIAPCANAKDLDLRSFLLGTCLAVLCFQRGLLPIHASAVKIKGKAVMLAGNSGLGKSSLAAALHQRGAPLLSDDLCALDFQDRNSPLVWPAFPRFKLWKQSTTFLKIPTDKAEQTSTEADKFHIPLSPDAFSAEPLPVGALVALGRSGTTDPAKITRLDALAIFQHRHLIHRLVLGEALGYQALIFHGLASLARAACVVSLTRPDDLSILPTLAAMVEDLADSESAVDLVPTFNPG